MTGAATSRYGLVVIGASLGGLAALPVVLGGLPPGFGLPVVIAQHRSTVAGFSALAEVMQRNCPLPIRDAFDKDPLQPGQIYLAPPDYHVLVDGARLALSTEGRVQYARPSIDVLFCSAAESFAARVIAVVLTGANRDGVQGARSVKQRGGLVIVQDPATAESAVMPAAVLSSVAVDRVVALTEIAALLIHYSQAHATHGPRRPRPPRSSS